MTSSNLVPSSATSSPSRVVRFNPELESPSSGRPRRSSVPYPKVAQCKGSSDRKYSFDLNWKAVKDIVPVEGVEHANDAAPEAATKQEAPATPTTPTKRPRVKANFVFFGQAHTERIRNSTDPKDMALKELLLDSDERLVP